MHWWFAVNIVAIAVSGFDVHSLGRDLEVLTHWLVESGAEVGHVRPAVSESGEIGVVATDDLEGGALVLRVPQSLLSTPEGLDAALDVADLACEGPLHESQDEFRLALWLLLQKFHKQRSGNPSPWYPALSVLPDYIDLPVLWPANQARWFDGSEVAPGLRSQNQEWVNGFDEVRRNCSAAMTGVERSQWMWAMSNIVSRTYSVRIGGDETIAMIPFADLFNHELPSDLVYSKELNGSFVMRTKHAIRKGTELHSSYGMQLPKHWVLNWGFLPPEAGDVDTITNVNGETPRRVRVVLPADEQPAGPVEHWRLLLPTLDLTSAAPTSFTLGRQLAVRPRIVAGSELALLLAHLRIQAVEDEPTIHCIARHWETALAGPLASLAVHVARCQASRLCVLLGPVTLAAEVKALRGLRVALAARRAAYGREAAVDAERWQALRAQEKDLEKAGISSRSGRSTSTANNRRELLVLQIVVAEQRVISEHEALVDFALPLLEEMVNTTKGFDAAAEAIVDRYCAATEPPKRTAGDAERERANVAAQPWYRFSAYLQAVVWPLLLSPHVESIGGVDIPCCVDMSEISNVDVGQECSRLARARALEKVEALSKNLGKPIGGHDVEL